MTNFERSRTYKINDVFIFFQWMQNSGMMWLAYMLPSWNVSRVVRRRFDWLSKKLYKNFKLFLGPQFT